MVTTTKPPRRRVGGDAGPPPPDGRTQRAERILDATAALLVRWGFRKTTIDDVAREAGVAKGTIYLHWKDKNTLFLAAVMRAQQQINVTLRQRIAADPDGGLPHRLWTHGLLAALTNPLMAAILQGKTDVLPGLPSTLDPATLYRLTGDYEAYIVQLQQAGLIRADLSVPVITFLTSALKIGLIHTPDLLGPEQRPSLEELTEAISDLIRRWLEPDPVPGDGGVGKRVAAEWLEKLNAMEVQLQQTEPTA